MIYHIRSKYTAVGKKHPKEKNIWPHKIFAKTVSVYRSQRDCYVLLSIYDYDFPRNAVGYWHHTNFFSCLSRAYSNVYLKSSILCLFYFSIVVYSSSFWMYVCYFLVFVIKRFCWISICRRWYTTFFMGKGGGEKYLNRVESSKAKHVQ